MDLEQHFRKQNLIESNALILNDIKEQWNGQGTRPTAEVGYRG
jgi:hypothetical protein